MSIDAADIDEFLEHFGVKGMQWGRRKSGGSTSTTPKISKNAHLSNDELRKVVDRMRLDQSYSEMSKPKVTRGKKYSQGLVEKFGSKAAEAAGTLIISAAIAKVISDKSNKHGGMKVHKGQVIRIKPKG